MNSNMTSSFRFVNKRAIYRLGIISLAHAPVHMTDFPVVNVHVDELSIVCLLMTCEGENIDVIILSYSYTWKSQSVLRFCPKIISIIICKHQSEKPQYT